MTDIGLFGGTFDPVHRGHLQCATAALVEAGMQRIVFIPAAVPPHKKDSSLCNFEHRRTMLTIAAAPFRQFSISDLERKRDYPSYTIDTLQIFQNSADRLVNYHFIIGCDAFLEIESWYRWQTVIGQVDFIIVIRPGYNKSELYDLLKRNNFSYRQNASHVWHNQQGDNSIRFLATETEDISSTDIRRRIKENLPWKHLVTDAVGAYIIKNSLYH